MTTRRGCSALDITRSFIVQAPAGSGKTGLLIQRFLALLATVAQPGGDRGDDVHAKRPPARSWSASSMRFAPRDAHREPPEPHDALTWRLARKALEHDAAQGWNLLAHPSRLRILTIDALCGALMRQAPLTIKLGASPRFVERAEAMYVQAAQEELAGADATSASWRALLDYLDNDAERVVKLLASMLGKRDQWLRYRGNARRVRTCAPRSSNRSRLKSSMNSAHLRTLFPHDLVDRFWSLTRFAA